MSDLSLAIDAYEAWKAQQRYRDDSAEMFAQEVEKRLGSARWAWIMDNYGDETDAVQTFVAHVRDRICEGDVLNDILEG